MDGLDKRTGEPVAEAKAGFASGPTAFLEHTVESFEQDTAALVELAADAFRKCPKVTSIDPDGTKVTFRFRSMSFPELGDRTLAMRATGSADGVEVILDPVYIAKGHNGVGISAGGLTPLPGADLEAVARKALAKLG
jgi:hypothetical protein